MIALPRLTHSRGRRRTRTRPAPRRSCRLKSRGSIPRDGFETAMVTRISDPYVAVRPKDRLGRTLGSPFLPSERPSEDLPYSTVGTR